MRIFQALNTNNEFKNMSNYCDEYGIKPNILMSYYYFKSNFFDNPNMVKLLNSFNEVMLDSGAFSAFTKGEPISVQEYADWVLKYEHLGYFNYIANLDDKLNWKTGLKNLRYLESRGIKVFPVYHFSEPFELLQDYCNEYPFVALAGIHKMPSMKYIHAGLNKAFEIGGDNTVFHFFGMTAWDALSNFALFSVDSSSWKAGALFGRIPVFVKNRGLDAVDLGDKKSVLKHLPMLKKMGVDAKSIVERTIYHSMASFIGMRMFYQMEIFLTELHGQVTIPKNTETKELE